MTRALAVFLSVGMLTGGTNITAFAEDYTVSPEDAPIVSVSPEEEPAQTDNLWDGVTMESIYEGDGFQVKFQLESCWDGGFNAKVRIDNTGELEIRNWCIAFDYQGALTNVWNAFLTSSDAGNIIVKNAGWNKDIAVGQGVEFGISCNENFVGFPSEYQISGEFNSLNTEDYSIAYEVVSEWEDGFNGNILVTNHTDVPIEEWYLEFDYNVEIGNLWNGIIVSNEDSHFIVNNCGFNSIIQPGETITIGFTGRHLDDQICPSNSVLHTFAYEPTENQDTYQDTYIVTFDCSAAEVINAPAEQTVLANDLVEEPIAPSRVGYSFEGWYADELYTIRYDFSAPVTGNLTLHAKWQWISDNLNDDIIDRGDIEYLKTLGLLEVGYSTSGGISYIYGDFWNKEVHSVEDAAAVLNASSSLWGDGFHASAAEIGVKTVGEGSELVSYYTYTPVVRNVPVVGSQIKLMVESTGSIYALFNSYDKRIVRVSTTPAITQEQAVQIAFDALLGSDKVVEFVNDSMEQINDLDEEYAMDRARILEHIKESATVSASLKIQCMNEDGPKLVYVIHLRNSLAADIDEEPIRLAYSVTYLITANGDAGQIIREVSSNSNAYLTASDGKKDRRIEVTEDGNDYVFIDSSRNISTYKSTYTKFLIWPDYKFPGDLVRVRKGSAPDERAVTVHANMAEVFDYYKNQLSRNSYDDQGAAIIITYDYEEKDNNAYWDQWLEQFVFTKTGDLIKAKDAVAHEFTHAVFESVVYSMDAECYNSNYFGETGGLNEAYGDIMGNLIEGKRDGGQWTYAETVEIGRDMRNPTDYDQVEHYSDIIDYVHSPYDRGGVHTIGGVINKAAYLMMTDDRTYRITSRTWAKIFYGSMFNLTETATFLQARQSIICEARKRHFTSEQLQAIKDAFDEVGVIEPDAIEIVLTWGASPKDLDSHLVGPVASSENRFHLYYGKRDIGDAGTDSWQADLDYDDGSAFGPEVITIRQLVPGTYYFYVYDFSDGGLSNSSVLSNSGAKVRVYRGNEITPINEFTVRPNQVGTYWNVFKLTVDSDNRVDIETIDTYSNTVLYH